MLDLNPKSAISIAPSRPGKRGVSRSSRTRGGMRWTWAASLTNEAGCGRQAVWSWHPDAGVKFVERSTGDGG